LLLNASSFALSSQSVLPGFLELFENVLWGGFLELGAVCGRLFGALTSVSLSQYFVFRFYL